MNISTDKDGYTTIYCHECEEDMLIDPATGIGEVTHDQGQIQCMWCDTLLGYDKDLEEFNRESK